MIDGQTVVVSQLPAVEFAPDQSVAVTQLPAVKFAPDQNVAVSQLPAVELAENQSLAVTQLPALELKPDQVIKLKVSEQLTARESVMPFLLLRMLSVAASLSKRSGQHCGYFN